MGTQYCGVKLGMKVPLLSVLLVACLLAQSGQSFAETGGLPGPSSVEADLTPGDGLTDPQFRSDFPRNIAPGWFEW